MSNARDKANIPSLNFSSTGIDDNATSTAITIDSGENVGIGTTSTQGRLLIKTNTSGFTSNPSLISSGQISFSNSSGATALPTIMGRSDNNGGLQLMGATINAPSVADILFDIRENDNTDYATTTGYGFRFSRYGNELMRLTRDGKLGIGTSSPTGIGSDTALEIAGSVSPGLVINDTGQAEKYQLYADSTKFKMNYGATNFLTYNASDGNVGIGTSSPTQKLDVNGTVKATAFQGDGSALTGVGGVNTPAFEAKRSSDQFPSNSTLTTLALSSENFDVGGCYNNTGSTVTLNGISVPAYSFAPNVAGKYYIFARLSVNATGSDNVSRAYVQIFKNTNAICIGDFNSLNNSDIITPSAEIIVELNGTSDYVTAKGYGTVTSDTLRFKGDATESRTYFGAYKLIE